jgi:NAD(P)H-hydrate repair Nnr-like enzyme with NAD(P)H-hydrate epimerase domain
LGAATQSQRQTDAAAAATQHRALRVVSGREVEILDGDINPETEKNLVDGLSGTIFNKELVTTYQIFIDECNKRKDIVDIMSKTITPKEVEVKERLRIKKFK